MRRSDKVCQKDRSTICVFVGSERNALMQKEKRKGPDRLIDVDVKATEHQKDLLRGYFGGNIDMSKLSYVEAQRVLDEMKEG